MIFEFIATLTAGFGMAGIALIIRHICSLLGRQTPKWLIPLFAAAGIFMFQIHQEYHWYEQKKNSLPVHIQVLKTAETSSWYRPWSYIKPQVLSFMALDTRVSRLKSPDNQLFYMVDLYLFERRMSHKQIQQLINCAQQMRADYFVENNETQLIELSQSKQLSWYKLSANDPILKIACR